MAGTKPVWPVGAETSHAPGIPFYPYILPIARPREPCLQFFNVSAFLISRVIFDTLIPSPL
jgi:hypothetical protein